MSEPRAQRTLVKSPPELWAEISDVSMLARHLGEFGDIRITRLEAETTVVWEGDRACGTVTLEPSGWGTKVTITAEAVAAEAVEEPAIVEDPAVAEAPAIVEEPRAEAEPAKDAEPVAETPPAAAVEAEAEAELADEPEAEAPRRRSLFARLFARRVKPAAVEPQPVALEPEPQPVALEPEPQPAAVEPDPVDAGPEPIVEPALDGEISATVPSGTLADDQVEAVLVGVLDDLGSAHHRPFSRG
jgi:hypothetical protein